MKKSVGHYGGTTTGVSREHMAEHVSAYRIVLSYPYLYRLKASVLMASVLKASLLKTSVLKGSLLKASLL